MKSALYLLFASFHSDLVIYHEHVYLSAMAMLLMNLSGKYRIEAERENRKGISDTILEPNVLFLLIIVIELSV